MGCRPLKFTLVTDTSTTPHESRFWNRRNIFTIVAAESNNLLPVMRQVLEEIHKQNHILQEQISSRSDRDIKTEHSHSMDDVISPKMWRKIEDIIGKAL